eukprot:COSAG04_NODE_8806_length_929_cov_1.986747_1_plen_35_part_10
MLSRFVHRVAGLTSIAVFSAWHELGLARVQLHERD